MLNINFFFLEYFAYLWIKHLNVKKDLMINMFLKLRLPSEIFYV